MLAVDIATDSSSLEGSNKEFTGKRNLKDRASLGKMVECRICHEEDEDCNMEIPCSCSGSLKYAHRKCVQRWCNEKGDTMCEICLQQYKPGYAASPKLFHYGSLPMNFRGNWEITRDDISDSEIITLFPGEYDQVELGVRSMVGCRSIAIIFTVLLLLRHLLPLMLLSGFEQYSFSPFSLFVLRTAGILLTVFLIIRILKTYHQCGRRQRTHRLSRPADGVNRINTWQLVEP